MNNKDFLADLFRDEQSAVNCVGYSERELDKISRLYDIRIEGQLKLFLSGMGKCDGGLIGDSQVQLYRTSWMVGSICFFRLTSSRKCRRQVTTVS